MAILALVIIGIVAGNYFLGGGTSEAEFFTSNITTGDITEAVAVTGFAEPVEIRVVQAEIPGVVSEVRVDFNQKVKKGTFWRVSLRTCSVSNFAKPRRSSIPPRSRSGRQPPRSSERRRA